MFEPSDNEDQGFIIGTPPERVFQSTMTTTQPHNPGNSDSPPSTAKKATLPRHTIAWTQDGMPVFDHLSINDHELEPLHMEFQKDQKESLQMDDDEFFLGDLIHKRVEEINNNRISQRSQQANSSQNLSIGSQVIANPMKHEFSTDAGALSTDAYVVVDSAQNDILPLKIEKPVINPPNTIVFSDDEDSISFDLPLKKGAIFEQTQSMFPVIPHERLHLTQMDTELNEMETPKVEKKKKFFESQSPTTPFTRKFLLDAAEKSTPKSVDTFFPYISGHVTDCIQSNSDFKEMIVLEQKQDSISTYEVHLYGEWGRLEVDIGTRVTIVCPVFDEGVIIIDIVSDSPSFIVFHPHILISPSNLSSALRCSRQGAFNKLFSDLCMPSPNPNVPKGSILDSNYANLAGQFIHEYCEQVVTLYNAKQPILHKELFTEVCDKFLHAFIKNNVDPEPLRDVCKLHSFNFMKYVKNSRIIGRLLSIEENISDYSLGLNGQIDALFESTTNDDPAEMHEYAVQSCRSIDRAPTTFDRAISIVDIKTGKLEKPKPEHAVQLLTYSLLIAQRYGCLVNYAAVFGTKEGVPIEVKVDVREWGRIMVLRNSIAIQLHTTLTAPIKKHAIFGAVYDRPMQFDDLTHDIEDLVHEDAGEFTCRFCDFVSECVVMSEISGQQPSYYKHHEVVDTIESSLFPMVNQTTHTINLSEGYQLQCFAQYLTCKHPLYIISRRESHGCQHILHLSPLSQAAVDQKWKDNDRVMVAATRGEAIVPHLAHCVDGIISNAAPLVLKLSLTSLQQDNIFGLLGNVVALHSKLTYYRNNRAAALLLPISKFQLKKTVWSYKVIEKHLRQLNSNQRQAVVSAMTQRASLVVGLAGTGKSHTVKSIIHTIIDQRSVGRTMRLLVVCQTNLALDNLLLPLLEDGVTVCRFGNPSTLLHDRDFGSKLLLPKSGTLKEIQRAVSSDTIQVIGSTFSSLNNDLLDILGAKSIIMDETTQVSLTDALHAIQCAQHIVLVGDSYQLPPPENHPFVVVPSVFSYFKMHQIPEVFLTLQYRMCKGICDMVSQIVYRGMLRCASDKVSNQKMQCPTFLRHSHSSVFDEKPIVFVDCCGLSDNEFSENIPNTCEHEARLSALVAELLLVHAGSICETNDVMLLTPFRAQLNMINELVRSNSVFDNIAIKSGTVDSSQGCSVDVAVISMVKKYDIGKLLLDWRRLNVLITRSRVKLIIIGNSTILKHVPMLDAILHFISKNSDSCIQTSYHDFKRSVESDIAELKNKLD
ncbi:hypothetical protein PCE1_000678 [Barthelona sp. PCE]